MTDATHTKIDGQRSWIYYALMTFINFGLLLNNARNHNQFWAGFSLGITFMFMAFSIIVWRRDHHVQSG